MKVCWLDVNFKDSRRRFLHDFIENCPEIEKHSSNSLSCVINHIRAPRVIKTHFQLTKLAVNSNLRFKQASKSFLQTIILCALNNYEKREKKTQETKSQISRDSNGLIVGG